MEAFRTTIKIENPLKRGELRELPDTLVDTGAELTWAPRSARRPLARGPKLRLDPRSKQLVEAGPIVAAAI